nr:class I SAM-dependent methyltransferase [Bosea sp. PAMC 26642]
MQAQRLVLDWAAASIAGRAGIVLELGLGNGRTYDHLREILPGCEIYAFDFAAKANPRSLPAADRLILGDMALTLPAFRAVHGRCAVLVHVDATTGQPERDVVELAWLPGHVAALAADDALVVSGWPLNHPTLRPSHCRRACRKGGTSRIGGWRARRSASRALLSGGGLGNVAGPVSYPARLIRIRHIMELNRMPLRADEKCFQPGAVSVIPSNATSIPARNLLERLA